jgi:hypothetical protein
MGFDIVTYCSENYADSLRFCLPGWVNKSGCEKVVVYTDGIWNRPEIEIKTDVLISYRPVFKSSNDWVVNVGRLPRALEHYNLQASPDQKFFFIGTDCLIVKNVSAWFRALYEQKKCLGGIRLGPCGKFPTNHFFGINTSEMVEFIRLWAYLSNSLCHCGVMTTQGKQAYDQLSYTLLIGYNEEFKDIVLPLDYMQILSECDNIDAWEEDIAKRVEDDIPIYGFHFKGGRWKDKELVKRILRIAGVENGQG